MWRTALYGSVIISLACGSQREAEDSASGSGISGVEGGDATAGGLSGTATTDGPGGSASDSSPSDSSPSDSSPSDSDGPRFDVGGGETEGDSGCKGKGCVVCDLPEHVACDGDSNDPFHALGLNCPGSDMVTATIDGDAGAVGIRSGFGNTGEWAPREGSKYLVLGTGLVSELDDDPPPLDPAFPTELGSPTYCNDELGVYGVTLPAPMDAAPVTGNCADDPTRVGTGDCSGTIEDQLSQGGSINDYIEARVVATVPAGSNSISYDFAFFSTEYPFYFGRLYNDMYIGWLESESWTGNISFDELGNPISLNAGFLDFKYDYTPPLFPFPPPPPPPPPIPELEGSCMELHAGTKWLTTTAPVTPGEEITLVFAIFDLSDAALDSYVFLDNFQWGCDGTEQPTTVPVP